MKRIGYISVQEIGDVIVLGVVVRIHFLNKLVADRGGKEVSIPRAGSSGPWQVGASVCRIVRSEDDLPGEQMLNTEVPLIDFRVAGLIRTEIVAVAKTPFRQSTIFRSLGRRQSSGERIVKMGELRLVIVGGELDLGRLAERGTGVLEVRRHVHTVEDPRAAAEDGVGSQLVGEAKAGCPVIAVDGCGATRGTGKNRGSHNLSQSGNVDSGVAREIAELEPVEPLGVGITPFVA